MPSFP